MTGTRSDTAWIRARDLQVGDVVVGEWTPTEAWATDGWVYDGDREVVYVDIVVLPPTDPTDSGCEAVRVVFDPLDDFVLDGSGWMHPDHSWLEIET